MQAATKAQLHMHTCVVLWGFTAVLGKLITLPAVPLVWWRMLLVVAAVLAAPPFWYGLRRTSTALLGTSAAIGVIIALHWLTFYAAVKLSNASITATCMALSAVFVALLEPMLLGRGLDLRDLVFGFAVIPGVALVVDAVPTAMRWGLVLGIISAFLGALFATLNKRIASADALAVTGVEMAAGALFITCVGPLLPASASPFAVPSVRDAGLLIALAWACTLLPFALWLVALRHLSTFSSMLAVNLEPVYAILLAILLLGEQRDLDATFYAGVVLIIAVVFAYSALTHKPSQASEP